MIDLAQWVWDEFGISIAKQTLSRELRAMGFRKLSARPRHHAQDEYAVEAFKKSSPPSWRTSRGTRPRVQGYRSGSRTKPVSARRTRSRGTRPRAPHVQRTRSAYIFGAICPKEGKAAGLVLPFCNSAAMTLHLEEISGAVAPDAHAVVVMDQAGCTPRASSTCPPTSPSSPCRRARQSSTRSKMSASSCATTGCPTASSAPTTTSSTIAARPGTSSSLSHEKSCQSETANGPIGYDQRDWVYARDDSASKAIKYSE